jgi:heme/copper-type cytochrome/quinol oxidase subunit 2
MKMIAWRLVRVLGPFLVVFVLLSSSASAQQVDLVAGSFGVTFDDRFVTVGDHFFAPNEFTVSVGRTVRFHVANGSPDHLHSFVVFTLDGTMVGGRGGVITPGHRVTVEWTPEAPGTYLIVCAVCPGEEEMIIVVHVI